VKRRADTAEADEATTTHGSTYDRAGGSMRAGPDSSTSIRVALERYVRLECRLLLAGDSPRVG
jgi:hypothetical protein